MLFDGRLSYSLIPLRIPHYPDIVLEVVTLDDHQRGGSSVTNDSELDLSPRNGSRMSGSQVSTAGSNGDTSSMDGDMEARRIAEMDDHQTPNGGRFERLLQEMDSTMALQEQLRQLGLQTRHIQGQLNDAQQRVQQTEQYLQNTQQQTQRLQDLQRTIDDALQNIQLSDQQTYESRRKIQNSIQRLQSVIEDAVQKTQQARQQAHEIIFYDKRDLSYVFVFLFICYTIYTILNYMVREDRFR